MKRAIPFLLICSSLLAEDNALHDFRTQAKTFYQEFIREQDDVHATVHAGNNSSSHPAPPTPPTPPTPPSPFVPPPNPYTPPANPPAPTAISGYLPMVIVNDSGFADSAVYVSVIGTQVTGATASSQQMYMTFSTLGLGSYTNVASSGTGSVPIMALDTLNTAMAPHTYAIYIPADNNGSNGISGARIYFEINSDTTLITYSDGKLQEPTVLNQNIPFYSLTFDKFEFAYLPNASPEIGADATAVDYFSVPLYGYLSTPDPGSPSNSGLYEPQSYVMKTVVPAYFDAKCTGTHRSAILTQWNNLISPDPSSPVRVLSPGNAMSVGTDSTFPNKFDPNYFDNAIAYGFSLLQYLWSDPTSAYYRSHGLYFQIPPSTKYPQPGTCPANDISGVYTATIQSNNYMYFCPVFTTETQSYFPAPTITGATSPTSNGPTSYLIFSAQNLNPNFAANLQGNQVSKLFEEAMIAGLLPATFTSTVPLSNTYLADNSSNYYSNASSLPTYAGGPWYDVYSQAIHYCGPIYAYGFDEPLYPGVLMQCTTLTASTYIGITIGTCDLVPGY
ncbi:MAG: hypothetical protein KGI80_03095 [Verrucomicrobiota bacterium]|nr:hypothetical protein [Verrucomicrobiota bacterium]